MAADARHVEWVRRVQAIAQAGLEYAQDPYDRERYAELRAIAAAMMAAASDLPADRWMAAFAAETGYPTPKVDVRGAVFRDGQVLLVREAADGCWSLPGGWADVNDPPSAAVIRELREETGLEVRCTKLVAVLDRDLHYQEDRRPFHSYKLLFLCEAVAGGGPLCHDIAEARFFPLDGLPELSLPRTLPEHVELLAAHLRDPSLPTGFD